jgi:hypothetical protein
MKVCHISDFLKKIENSTYVLKFINPFVRLSSKADIAYHIDRRHNGARGKAHKQSLLPPAITIAI